MRSRRSSGEPGLRVGDGLAVDAVLRFSGAIGEAVTFRTVSETELISRLIRSGGSPGQVELLVAPEWAVRAGENERLTGEVGRLAGHEPRAVRAAMPDWVDSPESAVGSVSSKRATLSGITPAPSSATGQSDERYRLRSNQPGSRQ